RPDIRARMAELFRAMKTSDLDSQAQTYRDLLDALDKAKEAKNWTAFASLMRLRMSHQGMLRDTLAITGEGLLSDEALVERLAGEDPKKRALLRGMLGSNGFAKPEAGPKH